MFRRGAGGDWSVPEVLRAWSGAISPFSPVARAGTAGLPASVLVAARRGDYCHRPILLRWSGTVTASRA